MSFFTRAAFKLASFGLGASSSLLSNKSGPYSSITIVVKGDIRLIVGLLVLNLDEEAHTKTRRVYWFSAVRRGMRMSDVSGRTWRVVMVWGAPLSKCVMIGVMTVYSSPAGMV
jgi:hypothetical protein